MSTEKKNCSPASRNEMVKDDLCTPSDVSYSKHICQEITPEDNYRKSEMPQTLPRPNKIGGDKSKCWKEKGHKLSKRKLFPGQSLANIGAETDIVHGSAEKRKRSESNMKNNSSFVKITPNSGRKLALTERQQLAFLLEVTSKQTGSECLNKTYNTKEIFTKVKSRKGKVNTRVYRRNERGETPLHIAAIKGDGAGIKKLIKEGAEVGIKDYAGWTALHEACNHGNLSAAKVLLSYGAVVNVPGFEGDTPLHDAVVNNHIEIVDMLLSFGAKPFQSNTRGQTPTDLVHTEEMNQIFTSHDIHTRWKNNSGEVETREDEMETNVEERSQHEKEGCVPMKESEDSSQSAGNDERKYDETSSVDSGKEQSKTSIAGSKIEGNFRAPSVGDIKQDDPNFFTESAHESERATQSKMAKKESIQDQSLGDTRGQVTSTCVEKSVKGPLVENNTRKGEAVWCTSVGDSRGQGEFLGRSEGSSKGSILGNRMEKGEINDEPDSTTQEASFSVENGEHQGASLGNAMNMLYSRPVENGTMKQVRSSVESGEQEKRILSDPMKGDEPDSSNQVELSSGRRDDHQTLLFDNTIKMGINQDTGDTRKQFRSSPVGKGDHQRSILNEIQRKETHGESKMEKPVMYICKLAPGERNKEMTVEMTTIGTLIPGGERLDAGTSDGGSPTTVQSCGTSDGGSPTTVQSCGTRHVPVNQHVVTKEDHAHLEVLSSIVVENNPGPHVGLTPSETKDSSTKTDGIGHFLSKDDLVDHHMKNVAPDVNCIEERKQPTPTNPLLKERPGVASRLSSGERRLSLEEEAVVALVTLNEEVVDFKDNERTDGVPKAAQQSELETLNIHNLLNHAAAAAAQPSENFTYGSSRHVKATGNNLVLSSQRDLQSSTVHETFVNRQSSRPSPTWRSLVNMNRPNISEITIPHYDQFLINTKGYELGTEERRSQQNTITRTTQQKLLVKQRESKVQLMKKQKSEQDKLQMSMEQEIVRFYNRNAYLPLKRAPPPGVCDILYWQNMTPEQLEAEKKKLNQRHFFEPDKVLLSSPEEIRKKYNKLKELMATRHKHEQQALDAVNQRALLRDKGVC